VYRKDLKAAVVYYGRAINKISPLQPKSPMGSRAGHYRPASLKLRYWVADTGIPVDDVKKLEEELKKNNKTYDIKIYPEAKRRGKRWITR
jgi:dienelactone hydrolase